MEVFVDSDFANSKATDRGSVLLRPETQLFGVLIF